jgi:hypothetical protein
LFYFESFLFQLAFVRNAMTRRAPTQNIRRPLLSGGYEQHRLTSYGVGHVSNRIVLGDEKWARAKHRGEIGAGCSPLTQRLYWKWEQFDTALYGVSNPNIILQGSIFVVSAKQAPRVRPFAKLLISQGE